MGEAAGPRRAPTPGQAPRAALAPPATPLPGQRGAGWPSGTSPGSAKLGAGLGGPRVSQGFQMAVCFSSKTAQSGPPTVSWSQPLGW